MANECDRKGPEWFTIKEAAAYLSVGEPTLYRWMRDGRITYRKVGDSTRFLEQDLNSVVEVFPSEKDVKSVSGVCPVCHHDELVDGDLRSTGLAYFHPRDTRFWTVRDSHVETTALMCTRCGNIVLRGDTEKLQAIRRRGAARADDSAITTDGDSE